MPFVARWTARGRRHYDDLKARAESGEVEKDAPGRRKSSKAEGLFKQVNKAIRNLLNDPKHPGLHTHEYDSLEHPYDGKQKVWEAYAQNKTPGAYRIFWCYGPGQGEITILAITPHP